MTPFPPHRGAFISDGQQCSEPDGLQEYFGAVAGVLERRDVETGACIALFGDNTLACAITILSFLARGVGFALCARGQQPPTFCRYVAHCERHPAAAPTMSPAELGVALRIDPNVAWTATEVDYRDRFYARTSGTTSGAKTALFTHDKLWANARNCAERFQLSARDRIFVPVPLSHMYGLGAGFLPALLAGASIDIQADSNILRYLQRESKFEPTVAYLTPTFCYSLTRLPQAHRRYRLTVAAGDKTPEDTFERYERAHGCLVSLYGSTELGAIAAGAPDDPFELRCRSVGRPMPGVQVVQHGQTNDVDAGPFQLCFVHSAGGEGYANDRGEVDPGDQRYAAGWFRSSDVGSLGDDGYLRIVGRSDHMVKRDGILVSFGDVESALLKNEHVEAAVVVSDGETPRGARLTAICVPRTPAIDAAAIRDESRKQLPPYAVPDRVVLVDDIPRLQSGKRDRVALLQYLAGTLDGAP